MVIEAGFAGANVMPQPPAPPPISLLTMAAQPGPGETDLSGNSLAITRSNDPDAPVGYRWEGGFKWLPRKCGPYGTRNDCGPAVYVDNGPDTDDWTGNELRTHTPVILTASNPCPSAMGNDYDFQRTSAIEALIASEAKSAELELADGPLARAAIAAGDTTYADNLWFTKNDVATILTSSPVSIATGLGLLEDFLGDTGYGGQGMLHVRRSIMWHLPWDPKPSGRQLFSPSNTLIVPGAGYTGNGPATVDGGAPTAPTAGTTWLYCTDQVVYRHGEIDVTPGNLAQALDRPTNRVAIKAERSSAATWDLCSIGAVQVSTP